jgi:hypothetical protein
MQCFVVTDDNFTIKNNPRSHNHDAPDAATRLADIAKGQIKLKAKVSFHVCMKDLFFSRGQRFFLSH